MADVTEAMLAAEDAIDTNPEKENPKNTNKGGVKNSRKTSRHCIRANQ